MNDNEFWIKVWKIVATSICVLMLVVGGCEMRSRQLLADAKDPVALSCAASERFSAACAVLISRGDK